MTNYFYARKAETQLNDETHREELMLEVPMVAPSHSTNPCEEKVYPVRICGRVYLCTYVWIPASYYLHYKRGLENDAKKDQREHRCNIPDGKGGKIKCPEKNSCATCERCRQFDFDNGHATSLDALLESGYDPESGAETDGGFDIEDISLNPEQVYIMKEETALAGETVKTIAARLAAKNRKYGLIFREMLRGEMKPTNIARNTGLDIKRTCEDFKKVQALAAQYYSELRK